MEKAEIEFLKVRNLRYRIIKTEKYYYLLDVEHPIFIVYFFPLLIYFFPHRCYLLTKEEYQEMVQSPEMMVNFRQTMNQYGFRYSLGSGLLAVILGIGVDINKYLGTSSGIASNILAIFILFMVFGIRIWITKSYKLPENYKEKEQKKIYIFPRFVKDLIFYSFIYLVLLLLFLLISSAFFTNQVNNYIFHINLLTIPILLLSMGNFLFLKPNNYWVKLKR